MLAAASVERMAAVEGKETTEHGDSRKGGSGKSAAQLFKEERSRMLAAQPEPAKNRTTGFYIKNKMDYDCFKNTERGWNL